MVIGDDLFYLIMCHLCPYGLRINIYGAAGSIHTKLRQTKQGSLALQTVATASAWEC